MNDQQYLTERLDDQLNWYDSKSQSNQHRYKTLRITEIVCAALIPFLSVLSYRFGWITATITGLLGISIAICTGINSLYKFHENWIQYRTTAEQLKHEKNLYLTHARPYNSTNRFEILVLHVESLISRENSNWSQVMSLSNEPSTQNQQDRNST